MPEISPTPSSPCIIHIVNHQVVTRPVLFISFLDYWQVTRPPLTILTWLLESQWLCTNTGVIALSFYQPLAPFVLLTHAQLAVVTQSCALLYTTAHCDLLLQWCYCSSDAYCSRYLIVLLQYISQACWVLWSPRLDFFHRTVISTLVAANRLRSPTPLLPDPSWSYSLQRP